MSPISKNVTLIFVLALQPTGAVIAADRNESDRDLLASQFQNTVRPFLRDHCVECHGEDAPEAKFDLSGFQSPEDVLESFTSWQHLTDRIRDGEMPPEDSTQPTPESRQAVLEWSRSFRRRQARLAAGDPGPVLARRLNVKEYNNTIRDLTGHDIRPARHFPVDRTNEAGFDNSGESLEMTPGLLTKYLESARAVSEHLVLTPDGIGFASHPVTVDTDRDKYCVRRIIEFYDTQNTHYADYFFAAWRLRQMATDAENAGVDTTLLSDVAAQEGVSGKYLRSIWSMLRGDQNDFGPIAQLRKLWNGLPDRPTDPAEVKAGCKRMGEFVLQLRVQLSPTVSYLSHEGINSGTQPFVLWRNRQLAANRRTLNPDALVERPADFAQLRQRLKKRNEEIAEARRLRQTELNSRLKTLGTKFEKQVRAKELSAYQAEQRLTRARQTMARELAQFEPERLPREELMVPRDDKIRQKYVEAFEAFCDLFPDTFFVRSRGRDFKNRPNEIVKDEGKVRLLSAGFHSQMGFFRDDAPLYDLLLSEAEQRELDQLWHEFDFVADISRRQHRGYIWYERSESRFMGGLEFDFARGEDDDITSEEKIERLAKVYLAKAERTGASARVLDAIGEHFQRVNKNVRVVETTRLSAEPKHVASITRFAEKAFRRPLSVAEKASIGAFYDRLRNSDGRSHETALRDVLVWILMSPHFSYCALPSDSQEPIHSLTQYALASRLSYFLWSSMPDELLLESAARNELSQPEILKSHVRRMIRDDRIRGFAEQFAGNWLGYSGFENHKGVDRGRFPEFDDSLRDAMAREPTEFMIDLLRRNGALHEFITADHTFVNDVLAKHYGIETEGSERGTWKRVENAGRFGRGGILPMGVFLTKNAHALRTSPVKRGYWVAHQLLGERIPPPPADVPELPPEEPDEGELSLVDLLAKHREHASCAGCHDRFDSLGVAFEAFDPIGRRREIDRAGRSVQTAVTLPDGVARNDVTGLREYIRDQRQQDFVENACRKLVSYALGRSLIVADDLLLDSMRQETQGRTTSLGEVIERIVTSPTFLNQRGRNFPPRLANDPE
ncbi:MAG: DUF1592 domain-containing protein [Planctomycetota bacterium]